MFFDRLNEACTVRGTSPSAVALSINRSKSNVTGWKRGQIPSSDTIFALAETLDVPTDFLLERPPFDNWELINCNRKDFLNHINLNPNVLLLVWGIDVNSPEETLITQFISFLSMAVASAQMTEEGNWVINFKQGYESYQASSTVEEPPKAPDRSAIKFALWGDTEVDDDVYDRVLEFAKFVREEKERKKLGE